MILDIRTIHFFVFDHIECMQSCFFFGHRWSLEHLAHNLTLSATAPSSIVTQCVAPRSSSRHTDQDRPQTPPLRRLCVIAPLLKHWRMPGVKNYTCHRHHAKSCVEILCIQVHYIRAFAQTYLILLNHNVSAQYATCTSKTADGKKAVRRRSPCAHGLLPRDGRHMY